MPQERDYTIAKKDLEAQWEKFASLSMDEPQPSLRVTPRDSAHWSMTHGEHREGYPSWQPRPIPRAVAAAARRAMLASGIRMENGENLQGDR